MSDVLSLELLSQTDTALSQVLNSVSDGVYIVDEKMRIVFWNRGAEQITGFGAAEVAGRKCSDNILNHVDECGTQLCATGCPLIACIKTGATDSLKVYAKHKDGHRVVTRTHVGRITDGQGRNIALIEVFRNIEEQEQFRQLQEKFKGLITRYVSQNTIQGVRTELTTGRQRPPEQRDLTIFSLDLVGYTAFTEQNGTVQAVRLLNELFTACDAITREYHGDIEKFVGDGLLAVFVDANDAVAAGRKICAVLAQTNAARTASQEHVHVRIGIHSGIVLQAEVGTSDRRDWTVLGDVVNTAVRFQALAVQDVVCITESTRARLRRETALEFKLLQESQFRGKTKMLLTYRDAAGDRG